MCGGGEEEGSRRSDGCEELHGVGRLRCFEGLLQRRVEEEGWNWPEEIEKLQYFGDGNYTNCDSKKKA